MKLNVTALALTLGLLWGVGLLGMTWWIIAFEGATGEPTIIGRVYRGYTISPAGSVIGLLWGIVDGLLAGAFIGWIYNWLSRRFGS